MPGGGREPTDLLEATLVAGIATASAYLIGFVLIGLHNPVVLAMVMVTAGIGWFFREAVALRSGLFLVLAFGFALIAVPFLLISPSYLARVLFP